MLLHKIQKPVVYSTYIFPLHSDLRNILSKQYFTYFFLCFSEEILICKVLCLLPSIFLLSTCVAVCFCLMEEDQIFIKEGNAFWFLAFIRCYVQMEMQWRTDAERKFGLFDNGKITKKSCCVQPCISSFSVHLLL